MIKLSPRERNIFIGVLIVGGIWAINTVAISPLLAAKAQAGQRCLHGQPGCHAGE